MFLSFSLVASLKRARNLKNPLRCLITRCGGRLFGRSGRWDAVTFGVQLTLDSGVPSDQYRGGKGGIRAHDGATLQPSLSAAAVG